MLYYFLSIVTKKVHARWASMQYCSDVYCSDVVLLRGGTAQNLIPTHNFLDPQIEYLPTFVEFSWFTHHQYPTQKAVVSLKHR